MGRKLLAIRYLKKKKRKKKEKIIIKIENLKISIKVGHKFNSSIICVVVGLVWGKLDLTFVLYLKSNLIQKYRLKRNKIPRT